MKPTINALVLCSLLGMASFSRGAISVTVDSSLPIDNPAGWQGFMHVSELPANGGAYLWNSGWGVADLRASFAGDVLTLAPNTIGDPDPYWYIGGGGPGSPGNKVMDANTYVEFQAGAVAGQTITFSGMVLENSLTSAHTVVAFIKDFSADYGSFVAATIVLPASGLFEIQLATIDDPGRHVQYGFQMIGVNVWATDAEPFGQVRIAPVPEPGSVVLGALGVFWLAVRRRR